MVLLRLWYAAGKGQALCNPGFHFATPEAIDIFPLWGSSLRLCAFVFKFKNLAMPCLACDCPRNLKLETFCHCAWPLLLFSVRGGVGAFLPATVRGRGGGADSVCY